MKKDNETVEFRGGFVSPAWYEAWVDGYSYTHGPCPERHILEEIAYERGQFESKNKYSEDYYSRPFDLESIKAGIKTKS